MVGGQSLVVAVVEVLQHDVQRAQIGRVCAENQRSARNAHGVFDTRSLQRQGLDLRHDNLRPLRGGGVGKLEVEDQISLVLLRDEASGSGGELPVRHSQQTDVKHHHQHTHPQHSANHPAIQAGPPVEEAVEGPEKHAQGAVDQPDGDPAEQQAGCASGGGIGRGFHPPPPLRGFGIGRRPGQLHGQQAAQHAENPPRQGFFLVLVAAVSLFRLEDHHRPRGRHRQGVYCRDDRRDRDRHRELAEELAADASQETARDEHRGQHQGDGAYRTGDFLHRLDRRRVRIQAGRDQPLDVFQHHDGVIHHDADGKHQPEQREVVQRIAQRRHDREGADKRNRHVDHRQDHRPPVLQEYQNDDRDQNHRVAQRAEDLVDRLADERRRVVDDLVIQSVGKARLQLFHLGVDACRRLHRVGAGQLVHRQRHGGLAVQSAILVVLLRPQLNLRHVAQPDHADGLRRRSAHAARRQCVRGTVLAARVRRSLRTRGTCPVRRSAFGARAPCEALRMISPN